MIDVSFRKNNYTVEGLYQWDLNQTLVIAGLTLPKTPEVHFAREGMELAVCRAATMDSNGVVQVTVPNTLLQKPGRLNAYVCVAEGEEFRSLYKIVVPVQARPMPSDYEGVNEAEKVYMDNLGVEVTMLEPDKEAVVEKVLQVGEGWLLRFYIPRARDGHTPVAGVDYWTEEEQAEVATAVEAANIAAGAANTAAASAGSAATDANAAASDATRAAGDADAAAGSANTAAGAAIAAANTATIAAGNADTAAASANAAAGDANAAAASANAAAGAVDAAVAAAQAAADAAVAAASKSAEDAAREAQTASASAASAASAAQDAAASKTESEAAKAGAEASAQAAAISEGNASASEAAAKAAQMAAEKARDEAAEVVGADFATKSEAQGYANTAKSEANAYTDQKLGSYALKTELPTLTTETWTFTLEDGSTVEKAVYVG